MGVFSKVSEWVDDDRREQEALQAEAEAKQRKQELLSRATEALQSSTSDASHETANVDQEPSGSVENIDAQLKEIARKVRAAHKRIQKAAAAAVLGVVELGEQLRIAKQLLAGHKGGAFGKWLKTCNIPRSSAHRAIQVFETLGDCPSVGQLDLSAAYQLSASGTPEAAIQEAIELTGSERVDAKAVRSIIAKHKPIRNQSAGPDPIVVRVGGATVSIVSGGRTDWAAILMEAAEQLDRDQAAA